MRRFAAVGTAVLGISVPAQSTFVGKVTDAAGRAIPGAMLWLGDGQQRATTAADGTFHVEVPQSGTYRVRLQRYGYQAIEARVTVAPDAPGALFNLIRLNMPTRGDGRGAIRDRMKPEFELDAAQLAELPDFSVAEYLARMVGYANRDNEVFGRPIVTWSLAEPAWGGGYAQGTGLPEGYYFPASQEVVSTVRRGGPTVVLMCSTYLDDACVYDDVRAHIAPGDLTRLRIVSRSGSGWSVLLTSKRELDTPR